MTDLSRIASSELIVISDGITQTASIATTIPSTSAAGLVVRDANQAGTSTTGTIAALNGTVSMAVAGYSSASFQVLGTWSATIAAQVSVDGGTNWDTVQFQQLSNGQLLASSSATGQFQFLNLGGVTNVRLQAVAYTSGTINVTIVAGMGNAIETTVSSIYSGFQPDPSTAPTGNVANLQLDNTNRLEIHGSVTSDEGSFRDDFSGTALSSNWTTTIGSGGSITVANSLVTLASGTTSGTNVIGISVTGDYLPLVTQFYGSISQRIANQTITFGLVDVFPTPTNSVMVQFTGTTNTQATFITQSSSAATDIQTTTVTLPISGVTSGSHLYKLDVSQNLATLSIDGSVVASQSIHLPGPYKNLYPVFAIQNTAAAASTTSVVLDYCYFSDWDRLQIDNDFTGEAIAITGNLPSNTYEGVPNNYAVKIGGVAYTTSLPSTVGAGCRVSTMFDSLGRICATGYPRQFTYNATVTLTATTATTTLVAAAGANLYWDLTAFTICNSSATACQVNISDGTSVYSFWLPSGGFVQQSYYTPISQGGANSQWAVQSLTSVSSIFVTAHFIKTSN